MQKAIKRPIMICVCPKKTDWIIDEHPDCGEAHHRNQNNDAVQSQETCFADVLFNLDSGDIEKEQTDDGEEARNVDEGVSENLPNLAADNRMSRVKSQQ